MFTLSTLYSVLFALSLTLINPWGESRGEIWTSPKILAIFLVTLLNLLVIVHAYIKRLISVTKIWKIGLGLWIIFLSIGLTSTIFSPFPFHSLNGNSTLGDGLIYWILIGIFVLSNSLVLQVHPILFRSQLYGVLIGGLITSLSIIPQSFDWRIDYTSTSGQITSFNPQRLMSSFWKSHMPIGLYSNRGHAAFVIATTAIISILAICWRWINSIVFLAIFPIMIFALILTQTRAGVLAFLASATYLVLNHSQKIENCLGIWLPNRNVFRIGVVLITISFISLNCVVSFLGFLQHSEVKAFSINYLETISTGRFHLLSLGLKGIAERPIFGWGFDGFGIAFIHIGDWLGIHRSYLVDDTPVDKLIELNDFTFLYEGRDGSLHLGTLLANKAHNLIIDSALSTGVVGLIASLILFGFFIWNASKSPLWGIEAVSIVYIVYTFFWFESAQYSHLFWWGVCFWNKPIHAKCLSSLNLPISKLK